VAGAVALAGCNTDDVSPNSRAMRPLPSALVAEIEGKNMPRESPILVRIFKEESELEVWKQDAKGQFALLKTYPICRWSGELGPKVQEGDRQAPEGFYNITPGQMNPTSNYYLAFNLGFPNAYDKANDRTGAFLMVHGDCSSSGCYAMTDEQIQEIYALGRDSFIGGQKSFQVQAYPFRMTPLNMARHRNNPNLAFWRMIKEGNDHFEATKTEPRVDVCEKRYVFDARAPANATPIVFRPREKCPVYEIPPEIAEPVKAKHDGDERAFADHVRRGVATVAVRTGTDGGMHPSFLARLRLQHGEFDSHILTGEVSSIPVPPTVNPLREPEPDTTSAVAAAPAASTAPVASNPPTVKKAPPPPPKSTVAALHVPAKSQAEAPPGAKAVPAATPSGSTSAQPAPWPSDPNAGLITGAAAVMPTGSFDGRWGGMR
jgi:murein L,D-transpeptidase YafK